MESSFNCKIQQSGLFGTFGNPKDYLAKRRPLSEIDEFISSRPKPVSFSLGAAVWKYTKRFSYCLFTRNELNRRCYRNLSANKKYGHKKRKVQK